MIRVSLRRCVVGVVWCLVVNCWFVGAEDKDCVGNCTLGHDGQENQLNSITSHKNQTSEVITQMMTPAAVMPTAMNMLVDEDTNSNQPSTGSSSIFVTVPSTDMPKGRSINFTLDEDHQTGNGIVGNRTSVNSHRSSPLKDLSDVSMDDEEDDEMQTSPVAKLSAGGNKTLGICIKGGLTYSNGEKIEDGCDTVCTCMDGKMDCNDRCVGPYFRKGKKIDDPLCIEKDADDPCCSILVCAIDTETEPLEMCSHQNKTYHRGEKFYDGCSQVCMCEAAGRLSCKPRCRPMNKTSDRCVEVPDPSDSCCKMILCDVTLNDHDHDHEHTKDQTIPKSKLISAKYVNTTTIAFKFDTKQDEKLMPPDVEVSEDKVNWKTYRLMPGGYIQGLTADVKYARLENTDDYVMIQNGNFGINNEVKKDDGIKHCVFNGETYKTGDQFYDNCTSYCICLETGVKCLKIQCPTYFGLDAVDPTCVEWETIPPDFVPKAPNCCPKEVRCKSNGSCVHDGKTYQNWQDLPVNITGCDKRCYCEMGKVECQSACPPVSAEPPRILDCPPHQAILGHMPGDDCCMAWICSEQVQNTGLPEIGTDDKTSKKTDKHRLDGFNNRTITKKPFLPTTPPASLSGDTSTTATNFAGPLLIYENDKPVKSHNKTLNELPDLQNLNNYKHGYDNYNPWVKSPVELEPTKTPLYVGPFGNDNKNVQSSKVKKGNKTSNANDVNSGTKQKGVFPVLYNPQPQYPVQNPEEILQIINQHPELANYPSGSVFEIHNYPSDLNQPQTPLRQPVSSQPTGPYLINQIDPGIQGLNPLQTNVPIDQLIKHVQEGRLPPGLTRPHTPNSPFSQNPIFAPNPGMQYSVLNNPTQLNQSAGFAGFPSRFPNIPGYQQSPDEINVQQVEAIDGSTVRLIFTVSPLIVGLHGRVEVRYTSRQDDNIGTWELQVFAPPNDLIATQQLEFDLIGLQPNTEYKIKITVILRDLHNTPTSRVYTVRTPVQTAYSTMPPMIPVDPNLVVTEANATWANVAWRKLTEFELQFVDGVQLRFKEISGKVYAATPLIHRAVTAYLLENLKPETEYEVGIFFIPFAGQTTELRTENMVHFMTTSEIDPYSFNVTLEIQLVKSTTVDVAWSGVPYPEDKYVNIYRAIYQSDSGKGDSSTFKIAKRDSPKKTTVLDLKPGTRYRLWLEVYLTNGKIKTSNVQDFITKPRTPALGASTQQGKLSAEDLRNHSNDYYGALVVVAILAALAILSTLILLMILLRRHSQNKAPITAPTRVSQAAYDNPTYKVEIQQETMGL